MEDHSQEPEPTSGNRDPPAAVFYQDVIVGSKPVAAAAAAASKACDGSSSNDGFVKVEDLERALAEISKMRLCVESILEKLPDKSYLRAFKEASDPDEAQRGFKPMTKVRYLLALRMPDLASSSRVP